MNLKLYRQKKKLSKGKRVFQGEDSHPYADGELLIVADGLGGRGGFPHTKEKLNPLIFDRETIYGALFGEVFDARVDEDFKSFVVDNFEEIFITAEYYFDSDETVRRSGYFASRIVTAIALYELKYNPVFDKKSIFERIEGATEEQKQEVADALGAELAGLIKEKLWIVAKNGGFELEVMNRGAYLLPSTLTVALVNERESDAEVLYLWAGDSRGYIWDEVEGMGQVTEDHEQDETMTNLITLSREFTVEGRFITVKKPCVIFNASDGVYKPPAFGCPIDQEYVFLLAIETKADAESAMKFLEEQYNGLSPDDSSTMALAAYGYSTYDELKAAVENRLKVVREKYSDKLPGIFDKDYPGDLRKLENQIGDKLDLVADELIKVDGIYELVRHDMISKNYAPYFEELASVKGGAAAAEEERAKLRAEIRAWVELNWIGGAWLRYYSSAKAELINGKTANEIMNDFNEACRKADCAHKARLGEVKPIISNAVNDHLALSLRETFTNTLFNGSMPYNVTPEIHELIQRAKSELIRAVDATVGYLDALDTGEYDVAIEYNARFNEKQALINAAIAQDSEEIERVVDKIISAPDEVSVYENSKSKSKLAQIAAYHSQYSSIADAEPNALSEEDIARKHVPEYWHGNERLYGLVWNSYRELVPDELINRLLADDAEKLAEREELLKAIELRSALYGEYNGIYYRQYRESRIKK